VLLVLLVCGAAKRDWQDPVGGSVASPMRIAVVYGPGATTHRRSTKSATICASSSSSSCSAARSLRFASVGRGTPAARTRGWPSIPIAAWLAVGDSAAARRCPRSGGLHFHPAAFRARLYHKTDAVLHRVETLLRGRNAKTQSAKTKAQRLTRQSVATRLRFTFPLPRPARPGIPRSSRGRRLRASAPSSRCRRGPPRC